MLHPQDIVVVLKLAVAAEPERTYARLAEALGISPSQAHASVQRVVEAGLVRAHGREVNRAALLEFLVHGLKYVFPCERGGLTRGMPTAHAAAPLRKRLSVAPDDVPPVWPDPEGDVRGEELRPLHPCVPVAARQDARLYELLVLVDAVRCGRAREREIAVRELGSRLSVIGKKGR
jgi:DNA-binding Lrp family transcriptional regulator